MGGLRRGERRGADLGRLGETRVGSTELAPREPWIVRAGMASCHPGALSGTLRGVPVRGGRVRTWLVVWVLRSWLARSGGNGNGLAGAVARMPLYPLSTGWMHGEAVKLRVIR